MSDNENYCYIAGGNAGLIIADVSNKTKITIVKKIEY
jgi:hypothetical protein